MAVSRAAQNVVLNMETLGSKSTKSVTIDIENCSIELHGATTTTTTTTKPASKLKRAYSEGWLLSAKPGAECLRNASSMSALTHLAAQAKKPSKKLSRYGKPDPTRNRKKVDTRVLLIPVESEISMSCLLRPPLRRRLTNVFSCTCRVLLRCSQLLGENFICALVCLWLVYIFSANYFSHVQVVQ